MIISLKTSASSTSKLGLRKKKWTWLPWSPIVVTMRYFWQGLNDGPSLESHILLRLRETLHQCDFFEFYIYF